MVSYNIYTNTIGYGIVYCNGYSKWFMPFTIAVTIIIFTTIANNILPILESRCTSYETVKID